MGQPTTRIPERNPNAGQRELNTGAMSIDQVVARHIGAGDRFNSLPLGVLTDPMGATIWTRMSYGALGQFIHPDSDPRSVYQRLFGGITRDANSLERLQRRRRSVLDLVLGDLNSIRRRVGREERRKLDMHLEGIRDMERGLFQESQFRCEAPNAPAQLDKDDYASIPQVTRSQIDLAITALACRMTKVTSIQVSHPVSRAVYSWVGNTEEHHDLSHATDAEPDRIAEYLLAERWSTEQFRYVLERLKATPSPDGPGTLFDDTLVLWAQEVGDSRSHESISVPFVLSGLGGGAFRMGRYLQYDHVPWPSPRSICRAFGMASIPLGIQRRGRWLGQAGLVRLATWHVPVHAAWSVGPGRRCRHPVHSGPEGEHRCNAAFDDAASEPAMRAGGSDGAGGQGGAGGSGSACPPDDEFLANVAWTGVLETECAGCHQVGGMAEHTRMRLEPVEAAGALAANLVTLTRMAQAELDGVSLLLSKASGTHPDGHGDADALDSAGAPYQILSELAARLRSEVDDCGEPIEDADELQAGAECESLAPGRRLVRRLSHGEYQNTIRDLLGVEVDAEAAFVADPVEHGFDNNPELLGVQGLLADQYRRMAETVGNAFDVDQLLPCDLADADIQCGHQFIVEFGLRAYRRPLTSTEITALREFFSRTVEEECFEQATRWVVTAMLQSPHFLYRTELGRRPRMVLN